MNNDLQPDKLSLEDLADGLGVDKEEILGWAKKILSEYQQGKWPYNQAIYDSWVTLFENDPESARRGLN